MSKRNALFGGGIVPMDPGERDRYVLVQQRSTTDTGDSSGFPSETWTTLTNLWMSKQELKGSERYMAQQLSGSIVTRWESAYLESMDPELVDVVKLRRLVYKGRAYDITSADQIGRREGIEFMTLAASAVPA